MSFEFSAPSVHRVRNMTAEAQVVNEGTENPFACLHLTFHGDGGEATMEAFFVASSINKAKALAAVINALTPDLSESAA